MPKKTWPPIVIGRKFEHWEVKRLPYMYLHEDAIHSSHTVVDVVCICGFPDTKRLTDLLTGRSKSCGCKGRVCFESHKEQLKKARTTLNGMKARCKRQRGYSDKGIKVCKEWRTFARFLEDMGLPPIPSSSIDRENNDLGYFKENCRWATPKQQANNRSSTTGKQSIGRPEGIV